MSEDSKISENTFQDTEDSSSVGQRQKRILNDNEWIKVKDELQRKAVRAKLLFPKRGELWTCMFGVNIGSEINDIRPCVIVQNDIGNLNSPTVIVVPISHRECRIATHVKLDRNIIEYIEGDIGGSILCEQIKTFDKARLGRCIGKLNQLGIGEVDKALNISLHGFILKEA